MAEGNLQDGNAGVSEDEFLIPHKQCVEHGKFKNPWDSWQDPRFGNVLKWSCTSPNNTKLPSSKNELNENLPIEEWDKDKISSPPKEGSMRVTWIGHATVLLQIEGFNILTDPVFSGCCAPLQVPSWMPGTRGVARFRKTPCLIEDLPEINAVLISHNHYDHLDYNSVVQLNNRFGGELHWFVPQKLGSWFKSTGCDTVHEFDWWEEKSVEIKEGQNLRFAFTPAQHWSGRNVVLDRNKTLWGSWCILGQHQRFYFAGDTGYCTVFKVIGQKYGPFDLAAIPIGAYEPRWFMQYQHVDPEQAVEIHKDIRAKKSVGIHWGTFALANEFYLEPPQKLKEALEVQNLDPGEFFVLNHGESREIASETSETSEASDMRERELAGASNI